MFLETMVLPLWRRIQKLRETHKLNIQRNFYILTLHDELNDQIRWSKKQATVEFFRFHTRMDDEGVNRAIELLRRRGHNVTLADSKTVAYTPG